MEVSAGLDSVLPKRTVYAEALGGWSSLGGPILRGEAGVKLTPNLGLFGFGQWKGGETTVGAGARVTF